MRVRIPYYMWLECQMYLQQNYIMPRYNYRLTLEHMTYTIEFYSKDHYEQFWNRYWRQLHMY